MEQTRLKIQDQPFQILALLLGRPETLVTREEIRQRLWPSGTFVDFDNGLNTALSRLREALGDSAESPRYIETLARRGYRWLVHIDWVDSHSESLPIPVSFETPVERNATEDVGHNSIPTPSAVVVPIGKRVGTREISLSSVFSPLRQLALIQTLFFVPAVLALLDLSSFMTERPDMLVLMPPWGKLVFGSEAAASAGGLVFTGLSALELWRGNLEAVRFFSRLF